MTKSKQQIINEITAHIQKRGGAFEDWCVGIAASGRDCLFNDHQVREKEDRWILRRAASPEVAREIGDHLLSMHATDARDGNVNEAAGSVYCYRKSPHTKP